MFLVIGVGSKIKQIGNFSCDCPACGRASYLNACKQYQSVNLFFIPVFPFGAQYIATCSSCASVLNINKEKGRAFERNPAIDIYPQDLEVVRNNAGPMCPSCFARVDSRQNYCPNCGGRL